MRPVYKMLFQAYVDCSSRTTWPQRGQILHRVVFCCWLSVIFAAFLSATSCAPTHRALNKHTHTKNTSTWYVMLYEY